METVLENLSDYFMPMLETKYRDIADGNMLAALSRSCQTPLETKYRDIADGNLSSASDIKSGRIRLETKYRDIADGNPVK